MKARINRRDFLAKSAIGILGTTGIVKMGNLESPTGIDQDLPKIKEYRTLGRTGFKVSDVGCGCILANSEGILRNLIAAGVNFIDTSESLWQNQEIIGKVVRESDRKSLFINTKIMISEAESPDHIIQRMKKFLEKTGMTYLDGMMLWNVNSIKETENRSFHTAFNRLRDEKLVRFSGVSCHGANYIINPEDSMEDIITSAVESDKYDVVMLVYNYVQHEAGEKIMNLCAEKNVGTLLMKTDPFGGYFTRLIKQVNDAKAKNDSVPRDFQIVYDKIMAKQKDAQPFLQKYGYADDSHYKEAAISFALSNPSVSSTLITFRNFEEVSEYVKLSGSRLDDKKTTFIESVKQSIGFSYCRHACGKCERSCPHGVPVNTIMRYNHYYMAQERKDYAIQNYFELPGPKAGICASCEGYCEKACPYNVMIHPLMAIAHNNLKKDTANQIIPSQA